MLTKSLTLVAILAMVGCASQSSQSPQARSAASQQPASQAQEPTQEELAAYAGAHPYPTGEPARNDLRAAAIVAADQGVIKIYNFGTDAIRDADVWVNHSFVRHISGIAPGTSISLPMANLYNGLGQPFPSRGEHVNVVQIQQGNTMQTLMGPAAQ